MVKQENRFNYTEDPLVWFKIACIYLEDSYVERRYVGGFT